MLLFILSIVLLDILDKSEKEKLPMLRLKENSTFNNDQSNHFVVDDRSKKQKNYFHTKLNQDRYSAQDLFLPSIKNQQMLSSSSSNSTMPSDLHPLESSIKQGGYHPKTLSMNNIKRWNILPKFPSVDINEQSSIHLLLTNVPGKLS